MQLNPSRASAIAAALLLLAAPAPAFAYMGPGLGLGAIGTALGVLGAIVLGLVSILWYPLKRMIRRMRGKPAVAPRYARPHAPARRGDR